MSSNMRNVPGQSAPSDITALAYSMQELPGVMKVSRATIYRAMNSGELKYSQVGRRRLCTPDHIRDFLQLHEKRQAKTSDQG